MTEDQGEIVETDVLGRSRATLVTVTHNSAEVLERHWARFDPAWADWLVIDNASQDASRDIAMRLGATVLARPDNRGFSDANNVARTLDTGPVLIFCNPDLEVTPDGIARLTELAMANRALIAPQLVNHDGSLQENGRGAPYPHRKLRHMLGRESAPNLYSRTATGRELTRVVWAMGAALAVRRDVMDDLGWWDDGYFVYYEDHDLGIRALQQGVPTYVDGATRWIHGWARETRNGRSRSAWKFEFFSGIRFYSRHPYCLMPIFKKGRQLRAVDRE
ncbi:glycosyltransferase family 2 protein [Nocardioides humi]|uniref:Glycosyltransferase 2-like domain-containing protein n=1 Tax=Nocardioides humi TaxID=449461 RepID=A0ABN2AIB1_9ACTN|nr:glycosyltransferase family 2 protein [Nocardioides humi]